jgi:hypothetical protein
MDKLLKVADMRKLHKQMALGEISYSRMVEIINEKANKQTKKAIEKFKVEQAKVLLKLHEGTLSNETMKLISKHA